MVDDRFWSFRGVEDQLVEVMHLWARTPGDGHWPFASDAPWHLMTKDRNLGDYDEQHGNEDGRPRRQPLTRAEVAERDRISEWMGFVPERDRKLVVLVLTRKAKGEQRIKWSLLRPLLREEVGARGLGMRYSRAITAIAHALNVAEKRGDGVSSRTVRHDENIGCSPSAS